jgi:tRNA-specific 2-thiouridylase
MARPLFVIGIDVKDNIVYVGQGDDHPGLYHSALFVERKNVHWIRPDFELSVGQQLSVLARVRYRQALQEARLFCRSEGIYVLFNQPQRGISQGQFVAWYCGEELVGSGVIGFL